MAMVIADLARHGFVSCLPMSEHLPFDIVVVTPDGCLSRVQVKYASKKNNVFSLPLVSCYAYSKGCVTKKIDRTMVDGWAIYCPDDNLVVYVGIDDAEKCTSTMRFRTAPAINNQKINTRMASEYLDPAVLWRPRQGSNLQSDG